MISPRRGVTLRGEATYNFDKYSQKLHEIEGIWTHGGLAFPLDPSLTNHLYGPMDPPMHSMRFCFHITKTRMHSSRMRSVRCSGRLSCHTPPPCMPPPVDRITDACENITFMRLLLRTVNMMHFITVLAISTCS